MFYVWNEFGLELMECFGIGGGAGLPLDIFLDSL
jgi:hypothetical protein